jgi:uncharacterized protein YcbK (DUF882 family)
MITAQELNPKGYVTTPEQDTNLATLLERMNKIRAAYGKPMYVTSGLRSEADQARINPKASKSRHLIGAAVDIADQNGDLKKWIKANVSLLETVGLWCEHFDSTPTWVHFQCISPRSGNRFFIP